MSQEPYQHAGALEIGAAAIEKPVVAKRKWRFRTEWLRDVFRMSGEKSEPRVGLVILGFSGLFLAIVGRLVMLGAFPSDQVGLRRATSNAISAARPDILDRNGIQLATDVRTVSVFAEPRNILDKDEATELLTAVLPDLNAKELRDKLGTKKGFVWVKREITPRQQAEVHRLGIPGVGFVPENKRVYPNGNVAAHVLGFANVDNIGIAGIEKYIDSQGLQDLNGAGFAVQASDLKPVQLSIDMRVQHLVRDELVKGIEKYRAIAAAGAIMDVNTGEVIALVSLPDFDPNNPVDALEKDRINRMNVGVYEMGSTFKALTIAMALDSGKANINSSYSTAGGMMRFGRQVIKEYHGTGRTLTVPEVFLHSSNMGSIKMALAVGVEGHKAFLKKMMQLDRMTTELPESAAPIVPGRWGEINTATIAFGHGLAVAPLQALAAVGALVNGGYLIRPTFLKRSEEEAKKDAVRVIKPETSEAMRFIMRLNGDKGSARFANIPGYFVGGKTGTAEKVINGRYAKNKNFTTFTAIAPSDKPRYVFLAIYDEPKGYAESGGYSTAAWNAGKTTGKVIERAAPILGLAPRFDPPVAPFPLMARLNAWGSR
ncbi:MULTISPECIES: penicillin-binding protein 2 [unclassified Bosea (in: a-proteobacteria)]|uniref:peptidoglycan D,D-transpeptidase FtsI family protein n=1 Tax=unclassified Bosea (in: a-proteobacteria) TaxID=2653178 RepID=UPI000F750AB5|nr:MULTISPECIES: penicillin-binding protein 2 [unclassified Bosea (in: a-proteobacteria)]AZO76382.1 penicillin-binding protein [Bosea sp. Tri-49]RXT26309.1 penicillin-binding protein [Bosea sp. Tri-39]RXT31550.1 penicillin-binding protein [Bosea sp. Tri-54]